jgi:hypothetical protein
VYPTVVVDKARDATGEAQVVTGRTKRRRRPVMAVDAYVVQRAVIAVAVPGSGKKQSLD